MGFCLFNNVAVTAAALADRGERVLIVDFDAHHGNGTQDLFYDDPRVTYVSMHEWPLFPGTGALNETGRGDAAGSTVNFPFPAGTAGDAYLAAVDDVVLPLAEAWQPTWLLISAGFDAHRLDPLTDMGLTSGDYGLLTQRLVSAGRATQSGRVSRGRLRPRCPRRFGRRVRRGAGRAGVSSRKSPPPPGSDETLSTPRSRSMV